MVDPGWAGQWQQIELAAEVGAGAEQVGWGCIVWGRRLLDHLGAVSFQLQINN